MIRTILILVFIVIFLILSLPFFGITWIIGKFSPQAQDRIQLKMMKAASRIILFLAGTKYRIIGKEKIPADQPVLYIINHRSFFDILLTYCLVPGPTGFIGKMSLKKVPVLNLWLTRLHGFFLDREDIRQGLRTILAAIDKVKAGISIAICPEGTRGKDPDERNLLPFHEGSFKIAVKSGCPIVPVVIAGSSNIFEDHFPSVKRTPVIIEILDPIDPGSLTGDDKKFIGRFVSDKMQEVLNRNHDLL